MIVEESAGKIRRIIRGYELWASECTHEKTWYHYASDEQGSIIFIADDKEVRNRYEYDAWGNTVRCEESIPNRYRYTGQQYYLRARYYNPAIARFTQEDEYHGGGLNLYAYCDNNPVMYVDPSGYSRTTCKKKDPVGEVAKNSETNNFQLPTIAKSAKGVEGKYSVSGYTYRIDTNKVAPGEGGFHIHLYRGEKEIAKTSGKGAFVKTHKGKVLLKPSELNKTVRTETNRLIRFVQKELKKL